jgi:hypothetical protein
VFVDYFRITRRAVAIELLVCKLNESGFTAEYRPRLDSLLRSVGLSGLELVTPLGLLQARFKREEWRHLGITPSFIKQVL